MYKADSKGNIKLRATAQIDDICVVCACFNLTVNVWDTTMQKNGTFSEPYKLQRDQLPNEEQMRFKEIRVLLHYALDGAKQAQAHYYDLIKMIMLAGPPVTASNLQA